MGRAIVRDPKVFLFDEPLSNLDAKLRNSMRREIKLLHHRLGTTMIYVTHDQTEALTLADRIVVMSMGKVQQIGTPYEVYHHPANAFVGYFIGNPSMNFFEGRVEEDRFVGKNDFVYKFSPEEKERLSGYVGNPVLMATRPENIKLDGDYDFKVDLVEHLGQYSLIHGQLHGYHTIIKVLGWKKIEHNSTIKIGLDKEEVCFFDIDDGSRIGG